MKPDVLVTDAEPLSFYAARLSKLPCISIDNPQALLHRSYSISTKEIITCMIFRITLKLSIFQADKYLIYDFSNKQIPQENITFLKPLIQEGIRNQTPTNGNHIFVYQTSTTNNTLLSILKNINEQFIVYGFNKNHTMGNIHFKQFNENEFYKDIAHAKAVITSGGFTVLSEALYLKKPIFSIPLHHQFEQVINGKLITRLGVGISSKNVTKNKINQFLNNLDEYQKKLQTYNRGNQQEMLETIRREIENI